MSAAGFLWKGNDLGGPPSNLLLVDKRIGLVPEERRRSLVVGGRPGTWDFGNELSERRIELDLASGDNANLAGTDAAMRALADVFDPTDEAVAGDKGYGELVFDSEPDRYYLAKLTQDPFPSYLPGAAMLTVALRCRDPFAYSLLAYSHQTGAGVASIGVPVGGNYKIPALVELTAAAAFGPGNIVFTNTTTGEILTWTGTVANTDVIRVDTSVLRVLKNGAVSMAGVAPGSIWPNLLPDAVNTITVTGIPAASITKIAVTWRERWI